MDKQLELRYLSRVFGVSLAKRFDFGERPDFTISISPDSILGVEVTGIFASNSAAKLARNRGYYENLLKAPEVMHRNDREDLEVLQDAVLEIGESRIQTNLVRIKVPSMIQMLSQLGDLISLKSKKIDEYRKRCKVVDLIIEDEEGVLYWQEPSLFRIWLSHFVPRAAILSSGFREIYLSTRTIELGLVSVPLKGSLFVSDFHALVDQVGRSSASLSMLLACLTKRGYGVAQVSVDRSVCYLRAGAWVVEYRREKFDVRDVRFMLDEDPNPRLSDIVRSYPTELMAEAERMCSLAVEAVGGAGLLIVDADAQEITRKTVSAGRLPYATRHLLWMGESKSSKGAGASDT